MFNIKRYPIINHNLKEWVKFIWHFEADNGFVQHKLLPMENIDLLINLGDEMIYEAASARIIAPSVHVNGLRSQCSFIRQTGNINVWGISFYSFGLYPFINNPINDIQNKIVDLDLLSLSLADKLKAAVSRETAQCKVERIMESLISELQTSDRCLQRTEIIKAFMKTDDDLSIRIFCMNYGINQRTFERFVLSMTGYTPIDLRRIRRYQVASNQVLFKKSAKLSEIVYDNNYTDQSHFTKEFKNFSGVPPRTFKQEKITVIENTNYI